MPSNLKCPRNLSARILHLGLAYVMAGAVLTSSLGLSAQESTAPESVGKDRYRVELLFFTLKNPTAVEHLANAEAPTLPPADAELLHGQRPSDAETPLRTEITDDQQGVSDSVPPADDFSQTLLPTDGLHLTSARNRLRSSGRYDIVFFAAWEEAFPPGHKTPPLVIYAGDSKNGHSDIEGYIQIERQRYLHVITQLYDLELNPPQDASETSMGSIRLGDEGRDGVIDPLLLDLEAVGVDQQEPSPSVVTWMQETRRMRSGEVHFLDSPTMGLLVYFEPLK